MMGTRFALLLLAGAILAWPQVGLAQQTGDEPSAESMSAEEAANLAAQDYAERCAACHGGDGTGQGPVGAQQGVVVPDLTTLTQRYGGEFPWLRVIETIDGRRHTIDEQGRIMPLWGDQLAAESAGEYHIFGEAFVARMRIIALAKHLESLQVRAE